MIQHKDRLTKHFFAGVAGLMQHRGVAEQNRGVFWQNRNIHIRRVLIQGAESRFALPQRFFRLFTLGDVLDLRDEI